MKTKITLEIETDFNKIFCDESLEEEVTKEVEKQFHDLVFGLVEKIVEDGYNDVYEDMEYCPDGWDNIDEFGKIEMKATQENIN